MVDPFVVIATGLVAFVFVAVGSFLGTTMALRSYHDDESPSLAAAVDVLRDLW